MPRALAIICPAPGAPLELDEIEVFGPAEGEVLIEIVATGLCHTDLTALEGTNASAIYPLIPGHEGAGRVVELGRGVSTLAVGDHVIPLYGPECGTCAKCRSNRTNLCWTIKPTRDRGVMPDGTSRFRRGGSVVHHFMGTSTLSRYSVVPEIALARIRKDAPLHEVCLFGCGVTTGIGAAMKHVRPGDRVAVFGLGGIGVNILQGARIAGARQIIGIDISDSKTALARRYGMTDFVQTSLQGPDPVAAIRDLTLDGVDVAFECTGIVPVMRQSLDACVPGWGRTVLLGVEPAGALLAIPPVAVRYGKSIHGSYFGDIKGRSGLAPLIDLYMDGKIDLAGQITHRLRPAQVEEGFDLMRNGQSIRSVVFFE